MSERPSLQPLKQALSSDRMITHHGGEVEVHWEGETVVITGDARHIAVKRRAAALTKRFLAGNKVVDVSRRAVTQSLGDPELAMTVAERLAQDTVFTDLNLEVVDDSRRMVLHDAGRDDYVIRISADNDVVTLQGTVGTLTHRRLAEVYAYWTGACAAVRNELEVAPPEEDTDDELTDAILMTLEKDPMIDAGQIHLRTRCGVVTVEGLAAGLEQREHLVDDIWLVPGVDEVDDRISVPA